MRCGAAWTTRIPTHAARAVRRRSSVALVRRRLLHLPPGPGHGRRAREHRLPARARHRELRAQHPHVHRAGCPKLGGQPRVDDPHRRLDVRQLALPGHDDVSDLALHRAQPRVLLRAQHVHDRDAVRDCGLRALPGRAAALLPGVGLQRHGRRLLRPERVRHRGRPLQPVRGDAEHARCIRADDRRAGDSAVPPKGRQGRVGSLSPARHLRGDLDREPLLAGRRFRRTRGSLFSRARQDSICTRASRRLGLAYSPARGADLSSAQRGGGVLSDRARNALIESRLTPNMISMTGLALNLVAAVLVWQRYFFLAGVAFIVGSICDTLDGRYSRMSGKGTPFGAFLDSTLDRIEEGIVLTAVAAYFSSQGMDFAVAATVVAVLGSLMVSYTRARAEALGVENKGGLATRAVRVVILSVGLVFAKGASIFDVDLLAPAVYVLAVLTVFTVFQRVFHVRKALNSAAA